MISIGQLSVEVSGTALFSDVSFVVNENDEVDTSALRLKFPRFLSQAAIP